jgi:YihY family inner membrane protein
MKLKSTWKLLKAIFIKWLEDDPFQSAAALSYYTLFSLAPLLIISIAVAGFVFGREAAQNQIVETIGGMIGPESAQAIQGMIQYASNKPRTGTISTVLGAVALLFGAGGVVGQLTTALNKIWGVVPKIWPRRMGIYPTTVYFICDGFGSGFSPLGFSCCDRARNGSCTIYGDLERRNCLYCPSTRHFNIFCFCNSTFRDDL